MSAPSQTLRCLASAHHKHTVQHRHCLPMCLLLQASKNSSRARTACLPCLTGQHKPFVSFTNTFNNDTSMPRALRHATSTFLMTETKLCSTLLTRAFLHNPNQEAASMQVSGVTMSPDCCTSTGPELTTCFERSFVAIAHLHGAKKQLTVAS